jgi:hypothetical protein
MEDIHRLYPDWPNPTPEKRGTPRHIIHFDADTFAIAPLPNSDELYDVQMIVALKPLRTATGMDATAMDDLENVIMHGALRDLLILPGKNWSDRELASYHAKQFTFKISERRARAALGAGRAAVSVQMRPLA